MSVKIISKIIAGRRIFGPHPEEARSRRLEGWAAGEIGPHGSHGDAYIVRRRAKTRSSP